MMGCRLSSMYEECFKQRCIDSYLFIPMHLAKTSAVLNLSTVEKGNFPHKFNKKENNNYRGPYPDKHYYGNVTMPDKDTAEFDKWYNDVADSVFYFQKEELYTYGRNYVVLLREACLKYCLEFIECAGLDQYNHTTLASCCMSVYKTCFLPRDTLALTHNNTYVN